MLTRRLEWPLIFLCLGLCMVLLGLVIANKRRVWWLLALAPVLALFVFRFGPASRQRLYILDAPTFVSAQSDFVPAQDWWVVGVVFEDQAYAFPYWALWNTPVVFVTDYDKRMVLMWSARANRALAFRVAREFKARDLEFVSTPMDSPLIFDRRLGQFIVALTGRTASGGDPVGLGESLPCARTTWSAWRRKYPGTKVLRGYETSGAPVAPVLPSARGTSVDGALTETSIMLVRTKPDVAIATDSLANLPANVVAGQKRLLIVRDASNRRLRVFDRNVQQDLYPTFTTRVDRRHQQVTMIDSDTNSLWSDDGTAIDGPLKGTQLTQYPVEEGLYWGVMKYWYPELTLAR
jgi:hypothetical protein